MMNKCTKERTSTVGFVQKQDLNFTLVYTKVKKNRIIIESVQIRRSYEFLYIIHK